MTSKSDKTVLTEMTEFFPVATRAPRATKTRLAPMQPGETREEALGRQQERTERIQQQIADRASKKTA